MAGDPGAAARQRAGELVGLVLGFALSLPEAWEDHPWGETVVKVGTKICLFTGATVVSMKLPESAAVALGLPGASPTGYGLGRSGWVTLDLGRYDGDPGVLCDFVEESYRAVAPKRLVRLLDAAPPDDPT